MSKVLFSREEDNLLRGWNQVVSSDFAHSETTYSNGKERSFAAWVVVLDAKEQLNEDYTTTKLTDESVRKLAVSLGHWAKNAKETEKTPWAYCQKKYYLTSCQSLTLFSNKATEVQQHGLMRFLYGDLVLKPRYRECSLESFRARVVSLIDNLGLALHLQTVFSLDPIWKDAKDLFNAFLDWEEEPAKRLMEVENYLPADFPPSFKEEFLIAVVGAVLYG